ncbi:MAG: RDD family protein [Burkholderiales bacterium]|nr:RDD family protein [Burkholderiales bacterium]
MRSSIYDALEIGQTSSPEMVQSALRAIVRRFWAVPRDASGDSEEAVRFAALAASTLMDPARRQNYDAALQPGVGAGPWRVAVGGGRDTTGDGSSAREEAPNSTELSHLSVSATPSQPLPGVDALANPLPEGAGWSSWWSWLWLVLAMTAFAAVLWVLLPDTVGRDRNALMVLAVTAGCLLLGLAMWFSRARDTTDGPVSLSRLAVIKWRRESSIFIGLPPPQQDTAWIFKFRLMELTRSAAGFITATGVARRFFARLTDYALGTLFALAVLAAFESMAPGLNALFAVLRSPLVLPVIVVLTSIPVEAAMLGRWRTTPGKWLFGLVVVLGTTRPADHPLPDDHDLALSRAKACATGGMMFGLWPIALWRVRRHWRAAQERETEWDAAGDSVMMARPLTVQTVAAALFAITTVAMLLGNVWVQDARRLMGPWSALQAGVRDGLDAARAKVAGAADAVTAVATTSTRPVEPAPAAAPAASAKAEATATTELDPETEKRITAAQQRRQRIEGYARQVEAARRSGAYGGLQSVCQRWTDEQPGNAEAWRCLGLSQYQNGAGRAALPALRQALRLEPNDPQIDEAILKILRP